MTDAKHISTLTPKQGKSIYLMQCGDFSLYKIGISSDPEARLRSAQCYSPFPLTLVRVWPPEVTGGLGRGAQQRLERWLHAHFSWSRVKGGGMEWFSFPRRLIQDPSDFVGGFVASFALQEEMAADGDEPHEGQVRSVQGIYRALTADAEPRSLGDMFETVERAHALARSAAC